MTVEIITDRLLLRELSESDVSVRYLEWLLNEDTKRNIVSAAKASDLETLKEYVRNRMGREDVLFLGIFDRRSGAHLGNIKYEPVDSISGYAIMGILIGEAGYRGKGIGKEALVASAKWLKGNRNIQKILLGVSVNNKTAIRLYEKVGFIITDTPLLKKTVPEQIIMSWDISERN